MSPHEWIVLAVMALAIALFISERLSIDLVALLIILLLVTTGVLTPKEGLAGFGDQATLTVAFMFVLSSALLGTGAVSTLGPRLSRHFRESPMRGMLLFMLLVGGLSAFANNTPIVALLIPVVVQMAHTSGQAPSKLLIPLSYATIMGGTITLMGTSTNFVVSGVMTDSGLPALTMFQQTPMGLVFLGAGVAYMVLIGRKLLPDRKGSKDLGEQFSMRGYVTDIELLPGAPSIGRSIMNSALVKELEMDIIEIRRGEQLFTLPPGDMVLEAGDLLKVRCDVAQIRALKDRAHISVEPALRLANDDLKARGTTLVELVITSSSPLEGLALGEADLIRTYRAVPLAVRHREEIVHDRLHDTILRSGDVILAEVKTHFIKRLKQLESTADAPFVILTEQSGVAEFDRKGFIGVALVLFAVVVASSLELTSVVVASLAGVVALVLTRSLSMKQVYEAIDWKIYFLMAGSLSLGLAIQRSGLADRIAGGVVDLLGEWGPIAILSGIYLITMLLTEVMSNTATAALVAPIAISTASTLSLSPTPFLMAVIFAASASFMTPIGYQTNTMIYGAGQYKARDFLRVGWPLQVMFWILASALIPVLYPF
ncbi:MAG: SLC13 family permease [Flavobacteriales bacterium]|jgi:di/tricarboxylate transporter|nr:SLC13 family permease [Flavobacteriales bacterium]